MLNKLKDLGWSLLGLVFIAAIGIVSMLFIFGGVWLSSKIYPWLIILFEITFLITIFVLLPLAIPLRTRKFSGKWLYNASLVYGATVWVWGLLLTYILWGGFAVFIGLAVFGVGVVPIAMLATLIKGMWPQLIELVILTVLIFGARQLGIWLLMSYFRAQEQKELQEMMLNT